MENPYVPPEAALTDASFPVRPDPAADRPTSATVFGILNIIFGGIGLLCSPLAFVGLLMPQQQAAGENPVNALMLGGPIYRTWIYGSMGLGIVGSAVLLASGIGLLRTRPWGRSLSIGYAWYMVVMTVIGWLMGALFTFGPLGKLYQNPPSPELKTIVLFSLISGVVGPLIGLIYPVLMLIFLNRPAVVRAFRKDDGSMFLET